MRCAACGTDLLAGKPFCHACGAPAAPACPSCGREIRPDFKFCPDCGRPLAALEPGTTPAPAPAPTPAPTEDALSRHIPAALAQKIRASTVTGERKLVTVLFCDLVGSTAIAERMDPEEYHELLEEY
jgi:hypothetical protein